MKKKLLLTLGALSLYAGMILYMPDIAYAESQDVSISDVASDYTGWVDNEDGTTSYYQNGVKVCNVVIEIGTHYYGFDYSGNMYVNTSFDIYDSEMGKYKYYRANEYGELYQNEWYENDYSYRYYYSDSCVACEGLKEIDGHLYYFYWDGQAYRDTGIKIDNTCYVADGECILRTVKNGWSEIDGIWYYVKNGEFSIQTVETIGTFKYYFDSAGRMMKDDHFSFWNDENQKYNNVIAKNDGTLYTNQWVLHNGSWYYATSDAILATGIRKIGNTNYLFGDFGGMCENEAMYIDGVSYAAGDNGIAVKLNNNSWTKVGKYWYYTKDNVYLCDTVMSISGNKYAFNYCGRMLADTRWHRYNSETDDQEYYYANSDGVLIKNQWHKDLGHLYYYGSDCIAYDGVNSVAGKLYCFDEYYGVSIDEIVYYNDLPYYADKKGVLNKLNNNAWTYIDGDWFYVKDNYVPIGDILKIGGKYYGFDYYGKMRVDERFYGCFLINNQEYYGMHRAKADGTLCVNEWYYVDDQWEYYDINTIGLSGINTIDGKKYSFYEGILQEDGYAFVDSKAYLIIKDGVVVTNKKGWYLYDGNWYYMNEDGSLYSGFLKLGNNLYYLGYEMYSNSSYIIYEDELYQSKDKTGVLTKITVDGLYVDAYEAYYISGGKLYEGWKFLDSEWRYFTEWGYMSTNITKWIDGKKYMFDANGAMYANEWIDSRYYATSTGALAVGECTIDGKQYVFDEDGYLVTSYYSDNGEYIIKGIKYKFNQGWNNVDGNWYYLKDKELLNYNQEINGKHYYFNDYVMLSNARNHSSYYNKDGAAVKGWFKINGAWYYAGNDYQFSNGLTKIGNVEYYFIAGRMSTSDLLLDDQIYRIGADGVVKQIDKIKDGWNYVGVVPYYYKNGETYTGWLGDSYIDNGNMIFDRSIYDEDYEAYYYLNKEGKYVRNSWINVYDDEYLYAQKDGKLKTNGWEYINGAWYYFDGYGRMEKGLIKDKGVFYYLDRNGKLIKTFDKISDGWHQLDGSWLYAINGEFIINGEKYIGGKFYDFSDGQMCSFVSPSRTFGADGAMRYGKGWYQSNGKWFYLGLLGGTLQDEWIKLGNNTYYISFSMWTGYAEIAQKLYYFDDNGVCKGTCGVTNGWYQAGDNWYYFINGKVIKDEVIEIGGTKYAFGGDGKMITNKVYYTTDNGYYHTAYFFGADGAVVSREGIYKTSDGEKVYVGNNGEAYVGTVIYVDGKFQYMDGDNYIY